MSAFVHLQLCGKAQAVEALKACARQRACAAPLAQHSVIDASLHGTLLLRGTCLCSTLVQDFICGLQSTCHKQAVPMDQLICVAYRSAFPRHCDQAESACYVLGMRATREFTQRAWYLEGAVGLRGQLRRQASMGVRTCSWGL